MAATDTNWLAFGDRSHPTLVLIDDLKDEQLTYDGWENDLAKLEELHFEGSRHDDLLFRVQESQRIHDGDHSHPRLVELDAIHATLTYDGWEEDYDEAVESHVSSEIDLMGRFKRSLEKMKRKQSKHEGDYSHPNFMFLYSLRFQLSFPGWKGMVDEAKKNHENGYDMEYYKYALPERQRVFDGDRSHPRLVALDSLGLTYPGWVQDSQVAVEKHLQNQIFFNDGIHIIYQSYLDLLSCKQAAYESGNQFQHPTQSRILDTAWSYPGFEQDMEQIEEEESTSSSSSYTFDLWHEKCVLRQMIYDGNFDYHEALVKLDELQLSYPNWQFDFDEALSYLKDNGYSFPIMLDNRIKGMKNKQSAYEGSARASHDEQGANVPAADKHIGSCAICFDAPQTHIFVPCGHICACKACSAKIMPRIRNVQYATKPR